MSPTLRLLIPLSTALLLAACTSENKEAPPASGASDAAMQEIDAVDLDAAATEAAAEIDASNADAELKKLEAELDADR